MNVESHDDFMKLGDMSDIDNRILAEAGQDDLVDRMTDQKEKNAVQKSPWMQEMKRNWFLYALLTASFFLTETLAVYLGMAPVLMTNEAGETYIHFHNDLGHLFTTLIYMIVFPIVTEVAFDHFRKKANQKETGNWRQTWTSGLAVVVSVLSWVSTGVAGAYVIFATLGSIGFVEVPKNVQNYLIWIIPSLLAFFALANWLYEEGSRLAKSKKMADEQAQNAELADRIRMDQIKRAGDRAIRAAAIRAFEQAVARGLLSQQEADAAMAQGKSLAQLERDLNRDITGEGKIGDISGLNRPAPRSLPAPKSSGWDCEYCGVDNPDNFGFCGGCGSPRPTKARPVVITPHVQKAPGWKCEDCGANNPAASMFCGSCGATRPAPLQRPAQPAYRPVLEHSTHSDNGNSDKPGPT